MNLCDSKQATTDVKVKPGYGDLTDACDVAAVCHHIDGNVIVIHAWCFRVYAGKIRAIVLAVALKLTRTAIEGWFIYH